jgi:pimeloyl-ACP methyl ester carboxylesterase
MSVLTKRVVTALEALLITLALLGAAALPAGAAPNEPGLPWSECYKQLGAEFGVTYECVSVNVPLDYDRPNGATIQLAVVRLPATDPEAKIGSIFLNPGGPGGSGVDFALFFGPFADFLWGPEVRARFDIVGFDPRGVQRSTPIRCFGTLDQALAVFPPVAFPMTLQEVELFIASDALLADQCDQRGNKVSDHMSTANVARDLDLLREKVGDEMLTYVGLSYGTYLGQTYANMFPSRVRSLVIDGVLDPIAWVNQEGIVPFSTRLHSDEGAQETLDRFFELCEAAGPGNCAIAPAAAARFAALADQLLIAPVEVTDPATGQTFLFTYQDLILNVLIALYNPFGYADLASLLAALEASASATELGLLLDRLQESTGLVTKRGFPNYPNFVESFPAVACEDSNNPTDYQVWFDEGVNADAVFGYFGRIWTWVSSPCAQWPLPDGDRYTGPFTAATANPVLVIGNLYDPATRYEGAQLANSLLPNSALLTVDMPGHTSLGINLCAGFLTGQYLLNPGFAAAIDGSTCPQEFNPFDLAAAGAAGGGLAVAADVRTQVMEEIAYRPIR